MQIANKQNQKGERSMKDISTQHKTYLKVFCQNIHSKATKRSFVSINEFCTRTYARQEKVDQ